MPLTDNEYCNEFVILPGFPRLESPVIVSVKFSGPGKLWKSKSKVLEFARQWCGRNDRRRIIVKCSNCNMWQWWTYTPVWMLLSYYIYIYGWQLLFVSIFIYRWLTTGSWKNASGILEKSWNFFCNSGNRVLLHCLTFLSEVKAIRLWNCRWNDLWNSLLTGMNLEVALMCRRCVLCVLVRWHC